METLEKESRTMKDVHALMQTMHLEKFSFVTKGFIRNRRKIHRKHVYEKLKNATRSTSKKENKSKYVRKLLLLNHKLHNHENIKYDKKSESLENASLLQCDPRWPVCLYDHTFKNRCVSYFSFRIGSEYKIIDDYFATQSFATNTPKTKARTDSALYYETMLEQPLNEESKVEKEFSEKQYNSLIVERNPHYCTNKEFVQKITKLLEDQKNQWIFDDACITSDVNGEKSLLNAMENYMDYISDFDELQEPVGSLKLDFVDRVQEITTSPGVMGRREGITRSLTANSGMLKLERAKSFHIGMYIEELNPAKGKKNSVDCDANM